jgi:hypothetical protein
VGRGRIGDEHLAGAVGYRRFDVLDPTPLGRQMN